MTTIPGLRLRMSLVAALRKRSTWIALGLVLVVAVVWTITAARAREPQTLDQRTFEVASQLQCPVCHGESVADAPSPLAQEMRSLIREQLSQGMSPQQVVAYFHQRYGDEILETPPASGFTLLIWIAPVLILGFGFFLLVSVFREWELTKSLAPEDADMADADAHLPLAKMKPTGRSRGNSGQSSGAQLSHEDLEHYRALLNDELEAFEGYQKSDPREEMDRALGDTARKGQVLL